MAAATRRARGANRVDHGPHAPAVSRNDPAVTLRWEVEIGNGEWVRYPPLQQLAIEDAFVCLAATSVRVAVGRRIYDIRFDRGGDGHVQVNLASQNERRVRRADVDVVNHKSLDEFVASGWPKTSAVVLDLACDGNMDVLNTGGISTSDGDAGAAKATRLADNLQHCPPLTTLYLRDNKIGDAGATSLANSLHHCPMLTTLDLGFNNIGDAGVTRLADNLRHCAALTTLSLAGNWIGDAGTTSLADNLQHCSALTTLDVSYNFIGDRGMTRLADNLQHCPVLTGLDLASNYIGDDGAVRLANNLQQCPTLMTLRLGSNNIGVQGVVRLADNLQHCPTLMTLRLGSNNIGVQGVVRLADNLQHCPALETLDLGSTKIGVEGGTRLADNLHHCPLLTTLDLGFNKIGVEATTRLADNLRHCPALTTLELSFNEIGDAGAIRLADNLQHCPVLTTLDVGFNKIGNAGATRLAEALVSSLSCIEISTLGNSMSSEARARLEIASHPELRRLLAEPSVPPLRNTLCVVGFQGVGKTTLVDTWRRRQGIGLGSLFFRRLLSVLQSDAGGRCHAAPPGDPDVDERDNKTAGMTMQAITLHGKTTTAPVTVVDCAGHMEYYLSHEVVLRCCPGAVFVVLFRLDRTAQLEEERRLMYWLKYVATLTQSDGRGGGTPNVFVVGTRFDVVTPAQRVQTVNWAKDLLQAAKTRFGDMLSFPQSRMYCINSTDRAHHDIGEFTEVVAAACERERKAQRRMAPAVCFKARVAVEIARSAVVAKIAAFDREVEAMRHNIERGRVDSERPSSPPWASELAPVMSVMAFAEHVLGSVNLSVPRVGGSLDVRPSVHPTLLRTILSYLHDCGDILWFAEEGELGDTVILAPDVFCTSVIGAVFRPNNGRGFRMPAVGGGGTAAVSVEWIAATLEQSCGIDAASTQLALRVLERLELCYRTQLADGAHAYLFPGAIAATTQRPPDVMQWMSGRHFCVGRQFELGPEASDTIIFRPGLVPAVQCWALRHYPQSTLWSGGLHVGHGATRCTAAEGAEAAVQLHCHAAARVRDAARGSDPGDHMVVVIVRSRGDDDECRVACTRLFDELCDVVRHATRFRGSPSLVERGLPPQDVAERLSSLDTIDQGLLLQGDGPEVGATVRVWGTLHDEATLWRGAFAESRHDPTRHPFPIEWGPEWSDDDTRLAPLDPASDEFREIQANMARSMPEAAANIHRIDRVQNSDLWKIYAQQRRIIADAVRDIDHLGPDVSDAVAAKETLAWHSTGPSTDPAVIYRDRHDGFRTHHRGIEVEHGPDGMKLHNVGSKSYGTGAYFTEHSIYGDTLRPHTRPEADGADAGKRQILVAKVVLGSVMEHGSEIPALRRAWLDTGYHSQSGTEGDMRFLEKWKAQLQQEGRWRDDHPYQRMLDNGHEYGRQYIVHRSSQTYPAYLVTYTHPNNS